MLVLQNINEFIKLSNTLGTLSNSLNHSNTIVLTNKLKQIKHQFSQVSSIDLNDDFFTSLHCLLDQLICADFKKGNVDTLLEAILDILIAALYSVDSAITERFLADFRFLPVITNILSSSNKDNEDDEEILMKILIIIRELLNYSSEINEHNMKLIIHSLRDYTVMHKNVEIGNLCLAILVNMCLKNESAKYLITRIMKQTALREKIKNISDNLVAFKYFILIEDEIFSNDVKYFLGMCLGDVKAGVTAFDTNAINHSLDVLDHIEQTEVRLDFKISDEENLLTLLESLNVDVVDKLAEDDSPKKRLFYSSLFHLYNILLNLDPTLVSAFESFTEAAFLSTMSKSANALKFLSTYIDFKGKLQSSEIIVEGLLDFFTGNSSEDQKIDFKEKFAFLCLLEPLQANSMLSNVHLNTISIYFDGIISSFKTSKLSTLCEEEVFHFIHFIYALSSVAKTNHVFSGKLLEVFQLDFLPMLIAKGHGSKNKDILEILFKLAAVKNFPNRKIALLLSRSVRNAEVSERKETPKPRKNNDFTTKFIVGQLAEDMELLIKRINEKLNSGDINDIATTDLLQLFRHKNDVSNAMLANVNEALDRSMFENGQLKQKIEILNAVISKQDFIIWCMQLDKERLVGETKDSSRVIVSLKNSIDVFQKKIDKKEALISQTEKSLQLKIKEIKEISNLKDQAEKKYVECKEKLMVMEKENASRITSALAEKTKLNQKLVAAEKEVQNLQELVKLQETQINEKEKKLQDYEFELKEAEQIKNTVMSLMSSKSMKK